jgi:hypothetical protein
MSQGHPGAFIGTLMTCCWGLMGCTSHYTAIHTNHGSHDKEGFHYFLPKPYLLVTNMTTLPTPGSQGGNPSGDGAKDTSNKSDDSSKKSKDIQDGTGSTAEPPPGSIITVQLLWLPDLDEEYVVKVSGHSIGTFEGSLQLENGWMLTGLNEKTDAKVAETLTAASGLLSNIFSAAGLGAKAAKAKTREGKEIPPFLYLFEIDLKGKKLTPVHTEQLIKVLCGDVCKQANEASAPPSPDVPKP